MVTILELKEKVRHLISKHNVMNKFVRMLNFGTESLDEILGMGKSSIDMWGIGYTGQSSNSKNMIQTPIQKNHNVWL